MKAILLVVVMFASVNAFGAKVINLSIFGKSQGPAPKDFARVNGKIGDLIADYKLNTFQINAYGIEGGYLACLIPHSWEDTEEIADELRAVKIYSSETVYSVLVSPACMVP